MYTSLLIMNRCSLLLVTLGVLAISGCDNATLTSNADRGQADAKPAAHERAVQDADRVSPEATQPQQALTDPVDHEIADPPLAAFQTELLDLAFSAAERFPLDPQIRNRAKAQYIVVEACLELDQPYRALQYCDQIPDYRRALGYADIAHYLVTNDRHDECRDLLLLAETDVVTLEDWRKDRVLARIAQVHSLLGDTDRAKELDTQLEEPAELGKLAQAEASVIDAGAFDQYMSTADTMIATGGLDVGSNGLGVYVSLFDHFYDDVPLRTRAEAKIKESWNAIQLPGLLRVESLIGLGDIAARHGDSDKASELADEAIWLMEQFAWNVTTEIPLAAKVSQLRVRAGDVERARADADRLLAMYNEHRDSMLNWMRADTLRPIAEIYAAIGSITAMTDTYLKVIEEGAINPNLRPRIDDLGKTCVSMAVWGFEPEKQILDRIIEIHDGLGDQS